VLVQSHYGPLGLRWIQRLVLVPPVRGRLLGSWLCRLVVSPINVAWVPLAPGEIYYGYGHFGPGSVNITTVDVNTIVVNRTYVNARHTTPSP